MKERISLIFSEKSLYLVAIVESKKLRMSYKQVQFAVDTGSPESFFSQGDVKKLNIPMSHLEDKGHINFGGSKHKVKIASEVKLMVLKEGNQKKEFVYDMGAVETTKKGEGLKTVIAI